MDFPRVQRFFLVELPGVRGLPLVCPLRGIFDQHHGKPVAHVLVRVKVPFGDVKPRNRVLPLVSKCWRPGRTGKVTGCPVRASAPPYEPTNPVSSQDRMSHRLPPTFCSSSCQEQSYRRGGQHRPRRPTPVPNSPPVERDENREGQQHVEER